MTEEEIVKACASAKMEIEPLLRIFKHTLIELYDIWSGKAHGFSRGMKVQFLSLISIEKYLVFK